MLSLDVKSFVRWTAVAVLAVGLSACFRPLYGPTASGDSLRETLAAIDVQEIAVPDTLERVSHYLRSELIFDLDGSGIPSPKRYKLVISYGQSLSTPIVDSVTGTAQAAVISATVNYTLMTLDGSKTIASGTAKNSASYDRFQQRFASIRAARDAEIRIAKEIADQIKTRLAAALSARDAKL